MYNRGYHKRTYITEYKRRIIFRYESAKKRVAGEPAKVLCNSKDFVDIYLLKICIPLFTNGSTVASSALVIMQSMSKRLDVR